MSRTSTYINLQRMIFLEKENKDLRSYVDRLNKLIDRLYKERKEDNKVVITNV